MPTEPEPPPQASRKRILPAFLLCFVFCAHRIYAGKIISGIVQIACVAGTFFWMKAASSELIAIAGTGPLDLETIQRISDWEQSHGLPVAPMLAAIAVSVWIAADAALLLAGKFTDGKGSKITRWV